MLTNNQVATNKKEAFDRRAARGGVMNDGGDAEEAGGGPGGMLQRASTAEPTKPQPLPANGLLFLTTPYRKTPPSCPPPIRQLLNIPQPPPHLPPPLPPTFLLSPLLLLSLSPRAALSVQLWAVCRGGQQNGAWTQKVSV